MNRVFPIKLYKGGKRLDTIINVEGLRKSYGSVKAVKGIDFYLEPGTLFAFLGPNGAGKSTTIDILCTLLKPDAGEITINGFKLGRDDAKIRNSIGVVFQDSVLDPLLTVEENLYTRGAFYKLSGKALKEAAENAIRIVGGEDFSKRRYGKLSGGQRRRADIARALVHTPKILFLDEPTTGLDPQTRKNVWDTVRKLQKQSGTTIFLTTHYMEEAAEADYVAIIDEGKIAAKGTPADLRQHYSRDRLKLIPGEKEGLQNLLDNMGITSTMQGGFITLTLNQTMEALPVLEAAKPYITGFEVLQGNMDDTFINITGKEIRE